MNMRNALLCLVLFALAAMRLQAEIPLATNANMVAFYSFADHYADGEMFVNPTREETMYATNTFLQSAEIRSDVYYHLRRVSFRMYGDGYVQLLTDVPGRYLFDGRNATTPMTDTLRSFRCVSYTSAHPGKANPSAWINNLGVEAAKRSAWTLEFFVKNTSVSGSYTYFGMTQGEVEADRIVLDIASGKVVVSSKCGGTSDDAKTNRSEVATATNVGSDGRWHHIAMVYEQPDSSVNGAIRLFVDYKAAANVAYVRRDASATPGEFRIRNSVGDGLMSAVRFSDKALTADEMMRASDSLVPDAADRIAFYPLDEQPVGDLLSSYDSASYTSTDKLYTNQVVSGFNSNGKRISLMAKAASNGGGVAFRSVADVPARYVYSSLASTTPLREPKTSLRLTDGTNGTPGTDSGLFSVILNVAGLSKDLDTVPSWTLEWFVKYETEPTSTLMYSYLWKNGSESGQIQLSKKGGTHDTVVVSSSNPSASKTVKYPDADYSLCDGKWHHVALVNRGGQLSVFCDYTLSSDPVAITRDASTAADETRFGQGCYRGMLSCIRATAAALDPREFMYASDSASGVAAATADWHWKLDGKKDTTVSAIAAETKLTTDSDQYVLKDSHAFTGAVAGDGAASYATPLGLGHRLIGGADCGANKSAANVSGAYLRAGQTGPLCSLGGTYTAEAMVSAAAPDSGSATVMGARTLAGGYSWSLKLGSSGALSLDVAMSDGSVVSRTVADDFTGAARHVAVRTDLLLRNIEVFVDYASVCALSAADFPMPLVYGDELVLGDGVLSGAFDEVRVTHSTIDADDFIHFTGKLGLMLLLR